MTKEDAKKFLYSIAEDLGFTGVEDYTCKDGEKMRDAIKILEQEPCGDCVSRQAAVELIKNYCENGCDIVEDNWCPSCQREQFIELLKAMPSVIPKGVTVTDFADRCRECGKQKKGYWITRSHVYGVTYCSECNFELKIDDTNFCPNCGIKMEMEVRTDA